MNRKFKISILGAAIILAVSGSTATTSLMADALQEAAELQKAGDYTSAQNLLKKEKVSLEKMYRQNRSEAKSLSSSLDRVSSFDQLDEIKKGVNANIAQRNELKSKLGKVNSALENNRANIEYEPYARKNTADSYEEFISRYPQNPFVNEARGKMFDLQFEPT